MTKLKAQAIATHGSNTVQAPYTILGARSFREHRSSGCAATKRWLTEQREAIERIDHQRSLGQPAACQAAMGQVLGDATWQPTFLFLMGYPTLLPHWSPRRTAEMVEIG